jgi:3-oxoacyl-[acyl-carrier-protein] synthase-1
MTRLAIKACGMVTSAGFNAPASLAAIRAGIRSVEQTNIWDAESGTYLAAGKVPLPQWWVGLGKLADLAAPAILECVQEAKPIRPQEIPVLLAVAPPDRPFRFPQLDLQILPEIEHRLGFQLHPASRVIPRDHISAVVALREAGKLIDDGWATCVIVAAVDSLLVHELKNHYLSKRRLLTPNNSNGFSLGEAGSAVLVAAAGDTSGGELQILGMAMAREEAGIESEQPVRGQALTKVIRDALSEAGVTMQEIHYRITDLNGEHYKFKEMILSIGRFTRNPTPELFDLWHPIEFLGDVGAAIGPVVLGVGLDAGRKGYGVGPTVLCTFGNDDGERAALVLNYQGKEVRS